MSRFEHYIESYKDLDSRNPYVTPGFVTMVFGLFLYLDLRVPPEVGSPYVQEDFKGLVLAILQVLPFVTMRRFPLASLTVIYVAFSIHATFEYQLTWIVQIVTIAGLFQVASTTDDRQSILSILGTFAVMVYVFGIIQEEFDNVVALSVLFAFVWVIGNIVRARRNRLAAAEITVVELESEQERTARESIREERSRIARELHDVLGHTLNLVVIQAGAAQRIFESSPEKAFEAIKSIETTSRQALSDVDRMLGILRDPDDSDNVAASLEARPSLARLHTLIDELKSAGQPIEYAVQGEVSKLAPSTDLTAYRVVQEALTNVITHASGSKTQVEVLYGDSQLEVVISNDGTGVDTLVGRKSGGRGIVGMRERTSLFGGRFEAGSTEDDGWRVRATFPISRPNNNSEGSE